MTFDMIDFLDNGYEMIVPNHQNELGIGPKEAKLERSSYFS